jgi:hypothetical protein
MDHSPDDTDFFLSDETTLSGEQPVTPMLTESSAQRENAQNGETDDSNNDIDNLTAIEKEFSGMTSDDMERVYDQFHTDKSDDTYSFHRIVSHNFKDGILLFTVRYTNDGELGEHILEVPFSILKGDEPLAVARYIRDHVLEPKRHGFYNQWSKCTLKNHSRCI